MNLFLVPPTLCAVVSFAIGAFVLWRNPRSSIHRSFASLCWETTWWQVCWFATYFFSDPIHKDLIMRIAYIVITVLPVTYYHYAVRFLGRDREWPFVRMGYLVGLLVFMPLLWTTNLYIAGYIDHWWGYYPKVGVLHPIYLVGSLTIVVRTLFILRAGAIDPRLPPVVRNRNRFAFYTHFVYAFAVVEYAITYGVIDIYPVGVFALLGAFGITSYAIIRHRLLDINVAIKRVALFALVYIPLLLFPIVGGIIFQPLLASQWEMRWWIIPTVCEALFAVGGLAVYRHFQERAEKHKIAERRRYQGVLLQASEGMTLIKNLNQLLQLIVHLLTMRVRVKHAAIYLWDEKSKRFLLKVARHWKVKEPPFFTEHDPLIECFHWVKGPLVTEELHLQARGGHLRLHPVVHTLKTLDAAVVVASFMEAQNTVRPGRCLGFLLLGDKLSGELYATDDLQVFQTLANQAALGIENARFYDELQRTQADLYETKKLVDMGRMAGGMSHQVNNRFHAISVMSEVIKKALESMGDPSTLDPAKLKEWWARVLETFNKIWNNALRGGDIAKKLIKYGKPSSDEFKPIPITVPEIAKIAYELSEGRIDFNLIDWLPTVPEGLPQIKGELYPLGDCISNLVTNSFDAIELKAQKLQQRQMTRATEDPDPYRGQIKFRVHTERDDGDKPWVVMEVADNGVGMTEDELDGLFFPFFTTKATSEKGSGLGLYVIRTIVEKHGGRIGVKSTYGVGTTFTIRLPALVEEGKGHA